MVADLQDTILQASMFSGRVTRPRDLVARKKALEKTRKTKQIIENTNWEAV